ncbi:IS4 family transposase [bacterium]|nr:IS4 family transposase [bacterium]
MSCRKILQELDHRQVINLPPIKKLYSFQTPSKKKKEKLIEAVKIECSLSELGVIHVRPVPSRYSTLSKQWKELMDTFHYLGSGPLCGAQIRYVVQSDVYGFVGALSFSASPRRLAARDTWIGWSSSARQAQARLIVNNSRFLVLPTITVPNLASHILGQSVHRLASDWETRYGYTPVFVETFVDPTRYQGVCYKAANWIYVGQTAGRSSPYQNGKISSGKKDIYCYPLDRKWRSKLCREPESVIRLNVSSDQDEKWYDEEFGGLEVYDSRLKRRLGIIAEDFYSQPGSLVPQACRGSKAKTKAAYRFFDNKEISMEKLLKSHVEATLSRVQNHSVILAVQDTTTLNYYPHANADMGPVNTQKDKAKGLLLHDTIAFTEEGIPLGLLDVQLWARDPQRAGKKYKRQTLPIHEKESMKWLNSYRSVSAVHHLCPQTVFVSVGDRESDIYELFAEAMSRPGSPELLVRADRSRKRKVEDLYLWDKMAEEKMSGKMDVSVPPRKMQPARIAHCHVHHAKVCLTPPKGKKLSPLDVWAVYIRECDYDTSVNYPLEWMLLTTVPTTTFAEACTIIKWYTGRWGIEVYHKTLKSGCHVLDRSLDELERLELCLALDMVVAWRIFYLSKLSRETPDISCEQYIEEDEWKILCALTQGTIPPKPPTLYEAVRMIGNLGGFLGRKGDGEPGTITMARGLHSLADMKVGFRLAQQQRDGPSP